MSFQPVIPLTGLAGWRFLQQSHSQQLEHFSNNAVLTRDIEYFSQNIAKTTTAEALVSDPRLMKVALGAFGLDGDQGKTAFLRKILEEGSDDPEAFANRLVDDRYAEFAKAFGYGNFFGPRTGWSGFAEEITSAYRIRQFEIAVGTSDETMRLALNFEREIGKYAAKSGDAAWFAIMGNPPLRKLFDSAFGLPQATAQLDLDQQLTIYQQKAQDLFGADHPSALTDPVNRDLLLRRYFARVQASAGPSALTPGYAALSLLQNASSAMSGLVLSRL